MSMNAIQYDPKSAVFYCIGDWRVAHLEAVEQAIKATLPTAKQSIIIDGGQLSHLDSGGAWLIYRLMTSHKNAQLEVSFVNFSAPHTALFLLLKQRMASVRSPEKSLKDNNLFTFIGKHAVKRFIGAMDLLAFVGEVSVVIRGVFFRPKRLQWRSVLRTIENTGYHALPIIALLSFLVGIVLTYQLGRQLEAYGANIFIVDLTGMAILREFGPLITAIIVAGRTGSSFTAQIGLMKVNEEIDALKTMGLSVPNRIVIPRLIGSVIVLPLLTIWSNFFAVLGSIVMAKNMLSISPQDFLARFSSNIDTSMLWTGLGKSPVFALAIALVGCFQGFRVSYTAESIGRHTTMSVVQAIFLIIMIDAIFSILYSWAGL